ncbi:MAG: hypothetical protein ACOCUI_05935 [bacterium]
MENKNKLQILGAILCLPLIIILIYLVMHPGLWAIGLLTVLFSFMFSYGFKLIKGHTLADIKDEIIKDMESIKEGFENINE